MANFTAEDLHLDINNIDIDLDQVFTPSGAIRYLVDQIMTSDKIALMAIFDM
jgi:hypothetical protein